MHARLAELKHRLAGDPTCRYLLTLGARRGLTFLEQQAQVDPERIGVYGHSMGGNLTVYVAGTDNRVKFRAADVAGPSSACATWTG